MIDYVRLRKERFQMEISFESLLMKEFTLIWYNYCICILLAANINCM